MRSLLGCKVPFLVFSFFLFDGLLVVGLIYTTAPSALERSPGSEATRTQWKGGRRGRGAAVRSAKALAALGQPP
jgi:hypothetical protein